MSDAWTKQVEWMRANGVVRAEWKAEWGDAKTPHMHLIHCELGPAATPETQPLTEEQVKEAELEQKRIEQERTDELDFGSS